MEYRKSNVCGAEVSIAELPLQRHSIIRAPKGTLTQEIDIIEHALTTLESEYGKPAFVRWFLSDATNQADRLPSLDCPCSVIQQPPLCGCKCAAWVVWEPCSAFRFYTGDCAIEGHDSYTQTVASLHHLECQLRDKGSCLLDGCMRTWFLVRDIDVNYEGVVKGRNEVFDKLGLTRRTHYITSTGIQGTPASVRRYIEFNSLCDTRLTSGMVKYLHGATHLNCTMDYGVAFERGCAVDYAEMKCIYISGTASIDNRGNIVAPGDIVSQTERMLENVEVLLGEAEAGFDDVAHMLVYLRDMADYDTVQKIFEQRFGAIPHILLLAPVCRPGWLIEMECMAFKVQNKPELLNY